MIGEPLVRCDITIPITPGMPVWPGDPPVALSPISQIAKGSRSNVSCISLATHTGTHIDPPRHFIADGATLDGVALDVLVGPADVAYLPQAESIGVAELESLALPADCQRLLLHTRNSLYWLRGEREFQRDYIYITGEAAHWLVKRGIRLIGVDYLSIDRFGNCAAPAHYALLGAGVAVIEGLNLHDVPAGRHQLVCLPLKIAGGDGAPVRAILLPTA